MRMERKEKFFLNGIYLPFKTTNEDGKSAIDCGNLWQKFQNEKCFIRIPGKLDDAVYAVYYEYEGDLAKPFSYFIGCRVSPDSEIPVGMKKLIIPEGSYRKFTAKGKMPDCIADTWKDIWESGIKRSYDFDFELYDERSRDWQNAEVNIFISIK